MDIFCRETLAGDWLEVIGLWQPGDARTNENNRPYTPHPDFWVAALWRKLMDVRVLGANVTNATIVGVDATEAVSASSLSALASSTSAAAGRGAEGKDGADSWVMAPGFSCNFMEPYNGSSVVKFFGKVNSSDDCKAKCAGLKGSATPCKSFSYCGAGCGGEWSYTCYGRLDDRWELSSVPAAISGCDKSLSACAAYEPPTAVRTFAHCSKLTPGAVMYAVVVTPCERNGTIDLRFPGARRITSWWLSALSPADDMVSLNGQNLTVSVTAPLPDLNGEVTQGDRVVMPASGVCTVGFVEAEYQTPVAACAA